MYATQEYGSIGVKKESVWTMHWHRMVASLLVVFSTLVLGNIEADSQSGLPDDEEALLMSALGPRVMLAASPAPSGNRLLPPATVTLTATVAPSLADPLSAVSTVEFYNGSTLLGSCTAVPSNNAASCTVTGLMGAVHGFTAVATNTRGRSGMSNRVYIDVYAPKATIKTPAHGAFVDSPGPVSVTAEVSVDSGTLTKVVFYRGATEIDKVEFPPNSTTIGTFGVSWPNVTMGTHVLTAKAYDSYGSVTTSEPVTVTGNLTPTVSITSPSVTRTFDAYSKIVIDAVAADGDGTISKVEFFASGTKIGESTSSPYRYIWATAAPGMYALTAEATDNRLAKTTSAPVNITAVAKPPICHIVARFIRETPPNNEVNFEGPQPYQAKPSSFANFYTFCSIPHSVISFQWYKNGIVLPANTGSVLGILMPAAVGSIDTYSVIATAYGQSSQATSVQMQVSDTPQQAPNYLPQVSLTAPTSAGAPRNAGDKIAVAASARDHDGYITKLEILRDEQVLRTFTNSSSTIGTLTSPFEPGFEWANAPEGNHLLRARAYDNRGGMYTSPSVQVNVVASAKPVINFLNPSGDRTYYYPSTVPLLVEGSVGRGVMSKVEFYNGTQKIDESVSPTGPYGASLTNPPAWTIPPVGTYTVKARGYAELNGVTTVSEDAVVTITVEPYPAITLSQVFANPISGTAGIRISSPASQLQGLALARIVGSGYQVVSDCVVEEFPRTCSATGLSSGTTYQFVVIEGTLQRSNVLQVQLPVAANSDAPEEQDTELPPTSGTAVGATAGAASVNDSGAASYTIPIALPPGTNGLVPEVALSYSSQGGGGLLGIGWSFSGVSTIHRCPKTIYTDGIKSKVSYDTNDAFCMDGQRLIPVSTGVYRTERDSFSRITQLSDSWKVETKSGMVMFYGTDEGHASGHARWIAGNTFGTLPGSPVKSWALSRVQDRSGNYYLLEYERDVLANGSVTAQRLKRIRYTGNTVANFLPFASVDFSYENSLVADQAVLYDGSGAMAQSTKRLSQITTRTTKIDGASVDVRRYTMAYRTMDSGAVQRSMLSSVTECGIGNGASYCLPATTFIWPDDASAQRQFSGVVTLSDPLPTASRTTRVVDLNGDGKSDLLKYYGGSGDSHQWSVILGGAGNTQALWAAKGDDSRVQFGDFNGDGATDFLSHVSGSTWKRCISTRSQSTGFDCGASNVTLTPGTNRTTTTMPATVSINGDNITTADFDGDGRIDLALYHGTINQSGTNQNRSFWWICLSTATGFAPCDFVEGPRERDDTPGTRNIIAADFDGDGRADLAGYAANANWNISFSRFGTASPGLAWAGMTTATGLYAYNTVVSDFNGDGLADLVAYENGTLWKVCLSRGDGTFDCQSWNGHTGGPTSSNGPNSSVAADFNGDGRTDIAQPLANNTWNVCLSTGSGFNCSSWSGATGYINNGDQTAQNYLAGDFQGTGRTSVAVKREPTPGTITFDLIVPANASPDLMKEVQDGLGKRHVFEYKSLTDTASGVYTKGTGASFPALDIQSPMYVVSSMSTNDGVGGMRSMSYTYSSLRGHAQGAGLLGFASRTTKDNYTNWLTTSTISQDYANRLAGVPTETITTSSTGAVLSRSTQAWDRNTLAGLGGLTIWQPLVTSAVTYTYDPNYSGTLPYVTSTTAVNKSNVDSNGNVGSSTVTTSDGFSKTTTTEYFADDTTYWLLGRAQKITVASGNPVSQGADSKTRVSAFTYVDGTHLIASETIEPDATDETRLATTYGYDNAGNRTSIILNGTGLPSNQRTSTKSFADPYKRFATSATNARLHTASSVYDVRFGAAIETTDANNNKSKTSYDPLGRVFRTYSELGINQKTIYSTGGGVSGAVMSVETTSPGSPTTKAYVDILGREIRRDVQSFDGSYVSVVTVYDMFGRRASVSRPVFTAGLGGSVPATTFAYEGTDKLMRVISETAPDGGVTNFGYDRFDATVTRKPVSSDQSRDQSTRRTTNSQGWTVEVLDAHTNLTTYKHDALGHLVKVTKPGDGKIELTYDIRGRKKTIADPDAGNISYSYNAAGELVNESASGGRTVNQTHDALGRVATREQSVNGRTLTANFTYDCTNAKGKLCSESQAQTGSAIAGTGYSVTRYTNYDSRSRVEKTGLTTSTGSIVTNPTVGTRTFESTVLYDSKSRPARTRYPVTGLEIENKYNSYGFTYRVQQITPTGPIIHWEAHARDADGHIRRVSVGDGTARLTTAHTYDSIGRTATIRTGVSASPETTDPSPTHQNAAYDWDKVGNLLFRADGASTAVNGTAQFFCYDKLNRVTHQASSAGQCGSNPTFGYDTLGNLISKPGVAYSYLANTNRLQSVTSSTGLQSLQYDSAGNIISDGRRQFTYNAFDLPDSIIQTSGATTTQSLWGYGTAKERLFELTRQGPAGTPEGNLTPVSLTWFAGPGSFEIDESYEVSTNTWRTAEIRHTVSTPEGAVGVVVLPANGAQINRYFLKDHLGSHVGTHVNAQVASASAFDVWGLRVASANETLAGFDSSQRGYTGHEHLVAFGLIHMNGRIYDPMWGRFLQSDPMIEDPYHLQSYNRYAYVMNNPLSLTDPTGYQSWSRVRDRVVKPVLAIAAAVIIGPAAANWASFALVDAGVALGAEIAVGNIVGAAVGGFAAGGIAGGNLNSALSGAVTGGLMGWAGTVGAADSFQRYAAHAGAGCAGGAIDRSGCGAGAASAVVGKLVTNAGIALIGQATMEANPMLGGLAAMAGGAAGAAAAGGDSARGAITAGLGYLFNHCMTTADCWRQTQEAIGNAVTSGLQGVRNIIWALIPGTSAIDCAQHGCTAVGATLAGVELVPAGKAATIAFKSTHYAKRLVGFGLDTGRVEAAVAADIAKISPSSLTAGADFSNRVVVDNVTVIYRAQPQVNGVVSVGTIHVDDLRWMKSRGN